MGYGKLDSSIFGSSIAEAEIPTRLIWHYFIIASNRNGYVNGTRDFLCRLFNVEREQLDAAIEFLEAPDPNSTSDKEEGRRIIKTGPHEWHLVNHEQYRNLKDADEVRAQNRERQAKKRKKDQDTEPELDISGFPKFWTPYPKKVGKQKAMEKWATLNQKDRAAATDGSKRYAEYVEAWDIERKFILNPTTYINQKRWTDELDEAETERAPWNQ